MQVRVLPGAPRRGAGVAERGALEMRCPLSRTGGSNPSPAAKIININLKNKILQEEIFFIDKLKNFWYNIII